MILSSCDMLGFEFASFVWLLPEALDTGTLSAVDFYHAPTRLLLIRELEGKRADVHGILWPPRVVGILSRHLLY